MPEVCSYRNRRPPLPPFWEIDLGQVRSLIERDFYIDCTTDRQVAALQG